MPSPRTNDEIETEWVNAWDQLYELIGDRRNVVCVLPDWKTVSVEDCQGWLQTSAYKGYTLTVRETWHAGEKAIAVDRTQADA